MLSVKSFYARSLLSLSLATVSVASAATSYLIFSQSRVLSYGGWSNANSQSAAEEPNGNRQAAAMAIENLGPNDDWERILAGVPTASLGECFNSLSDRFWRENIIAPKIIEKAFERIAAEKGAAVSASDALSLIRSVPIAGQEDQVLLRVAFGGFFKHSRPNRTELSILFRETPRPQALSVLAAYISSLEIKQADEARSIAQELFQSAGLALDETLKGQIDSVVVQCFGERGDITPVLTALNGIKDSLERSKTLSQIGIYLRAIRPKSLDLLILSLAETNVEDAVRLSFACGVEHANTWKLLNRLPEEARLSFQRRYCAALSEKNPLEATDFANVVAATELPGDAASVLCVSLLAASDGTVIRWLSTLSPGDSAHVLDEALAPLNVRTPLPDVKSAQAWLSARAAFPGTLPDRAADLFAQLSKSMDRGALLELASKLPPKERDKAIEKVFAGNMSIVTELADDPSAALGLIETLPETIRSKVRLNALYRYGCRDPESALRIATETGGDPDKQKVIDYLLGRPDSDVSLSVKKDLLIQHLSTLSTDGGALNGLAYFMSEYGDIDPLGGVNTCKTLPAGPIQNAAMQSLARSWSRTDPVPASEWIASLPAGTARDLAVRELVANALNDPEGALLNARQIANPQLRMDAAREVVKAWPPSNSEWIYKLTENAGFTASEVAELRNLKGYSVSEGR
jgi:hypothetical protein